MNYYNYFTEVEEHFVKRRGKHLLISPMDWNLIASWRDAGVPLHVALRGIDIAMDGYLARNTRGNARVNSLCYCHDAVMESYAGYLDAHVGEAPASAADDTGESDAKQSSGDGPGSRDIIEFLHARMDEIKKLGEKQFSQHMPEELQRILDRLAAIAQPLDEGGNVDAEALERDLAIIDNLLIAELRSWVTEEDNQAWEKEAKTELKVYKKRLPKETFDKIRENFFRDRTRRKFHIGELSIFRL